VQKKEFFFYSSRRVAFPAIFAAKTPLQSCQSAQAKKEEVKIAGGFSIWREMALL